MNSLLAVTDLAWFAGAALAATVVIALSSGNRPKPNLRRLERQIDALLERAGIVVPSGLPPEVQALANDPGRKIEAIKLLRRQTSLSLVEAKAAVEGSAAPPTARQLERKLDALLQRAGVHLPSGLSPEVELLARDPAKKIAAIKLHREQTGLSLVEAKDAVEEFAGF
jgi:ribosomal protein L7/L12